jgi:hypothetical protein
MTLTTGPESGAAAQGLPASAPARRPRDEKARRRFLERGLKGERCRGFMGWHILAELGGGFNLSGLPLYGIVDSPLL